MKYLRLAAVLLVSVLVLSFVSCAGESVSEVFDETFDTENSTDFEGHELSFVGMERSGRVEIDPWEASENTYWGDQLKERYTAIEKKYNVDITVRKNDGLFSAYAMSGLHWADFWEAREDNIRSFVQAKMMTPMNLFDDFMSNLDAGMWGTEYTLEIMKRGDDYYGFYPAYHGVPFRQMGGMLYTNHTVLSRYGFSAFEMIENGEWTWNGFENILTTIGENYQDPEKDVAIVISRSFAQYLPFEAVISNGVTLVKKDANGKLVCNFSDPRVVEALEWVHHLAADGLAAVGNDSGYYLGVTAEYQCPRFVEDKMVFQANYSFCGTVDTNGFLYTDVDFSMLPFPCGPSGVYGEWAGYVGGPDVYFGVPIYAETNIVDAVLYDLYAPFGEDKFAWKDECANYLFLHDEAADLYFQMCDNARPMYEGATELFPYGSVVDGVLTVESAIEQYTDKMQAYLDDNYNNF